MPSPSAPAVSVRWWSLTNEIEVRERWRRVCLAAVRRFNEPVVVSAAPRPDGQGREDLAAAYQSFDLP